MLFLIKLLPVFLGCPALKNETEGADDDLQVSSWLERNF